MNTKVKIGDQFKLQRETPFENKSQRWLKL